jgi:hypothetical protein
LTLELGQALVGVLVQVQGRQRWFQPSQNRRIAATSSSTLAKSPRHSACRSMIAKKTSTRLSQDA